MDEDLTGWQRACLSRAAEHLRNGARHAQAPDRRTQQQLARLRALRWLHIAATDPVPPTT